MFDSRRESHLDFTYNNIKNPVPVYSSFISYTTFFSGECDFLNPRKEDIVIHASDNIGDFTERTTGKVFSFIKIESPKENISNFKLKTQSLHNIVIIERPSGINNGLTSFTRHGV
jgi:hypothetical protein